MFGVLWQQVGSKTSVPSGMESYCKDLTDEGSSSEGFQSVSIALWHCVQRENSLLLVQEVRIGCTAALGLAGKRY